MIIFWKQQLQAILNKANKSHNFTNTKEVSIHSHQMRLRLLYVWLFLWGAYNIRFRLNAIFHIPPHSIVQIIIEYVLIFTYLSKKSVFLLYKYIRIAQFFSCFSNIYKNTETFQAKYSSSVVCVLVYVSVFDICVRYCGKTCLWLDRL